MNDGNNKKDSEADNTIFIGWFIGMSFVTMLVLMNSILLIIDSKSKLSLCKLIEHELSKLQEKLVLSCSRILSGGSGAEFIEYDSAHTDDTVNNESESQI